MRINQSSESQMVLICAIPSLPLFTLQHWSDAHLLVKDEHTSASPSPLTPPLGHSLSFWVFRPQVCHKWIILPNVLPERSAGPGPRPSISGSARELLLFLTLIFQWMQLKPRSDVISITRWRFSGKWGRICETAFSCRVYQEQIKLEDRFYQIHW